MAPASPAAPLAVVLLLVLAGCAAGLPGDGDTPTDAALPPGVTVDGVPDAERLEAAHVAALENATFRERARTTVRFENGSLALEETYVGRHGRNTTTVSLRRTFVRLRADGRARVVVAPAGAIRRFVVEFPVRLAGRNAMLGHVYTVERGDVTVTRPPWFEAALAERTPGSRSPRSGNDTGSTVSTARLRQVVSPPGSTRTTSGALVGA